MSVMTSKHLQWCRLVATGLRTFAALALFAATAATAQPVRVMPVMSSTAPVGEPSSIAFVNGALYFNAPAQDGSIMLWKSDGTAGGTVMLKEVSTQGFVASGARAFFSGSSPLGGGLWVTDGTQAGTQRVWVGQPQNITDVNGTVFFSDHLGNLFKSNGTSAGTVLLKQHGTMNGPFLPPPLGMSMFRNLGGVLVFVQDGPEGGLWRSDGTAAGTVRSKALTGITGAVVHAGKLLFGANDGVTGVELWISDGTPGGTARVKDISSGGSDSSPANFASIGSHVYFSADDGVSGREAWKSDGTEAGTVRVADIEAGSAPSIPHSFASLGSSVIFAARTTALGEEVWKTDGTPGGTALVKDIDATFFGGRPNYFVQANGALCFLARSELRTDLWRTDGTEAGTIKLLEDVADRFDASPLASNGTRVYFRKGSQLWSSDCASPAGNALVKDFRIAVASPLLSPWTDNFNLTWMGSHMLLAADAQGGRELWRADPAGGALVKDVDPGPGNGFPAPVEYVLGTPGGDYPIPRPSLRDGPFLWFAGSTSAQGIELWRSDGTSGGTLLVKDIRPGSQGSSPRWLTKVGATVFFVADDDATGRELWKSDGTAAGTMLVKDILPGPGSSSPHALINVNGTLFFVAWDGVDGYQLWKSDGTAAGTVLVKDIEASESGAVPTALAGLGATLVFTVGSRLWKTDGTAAGTVAIAPNVRNASFAVVVMNGVMYFIGFDGGDTSSAGLWRTDGTDAGTTLVARLNAFSYALANSAVVGDRFYFMTDASYPGFVLWVSDGTSAGTREVRRFAYHIPATTAPRIAGMNGVAYFAASDDGFNTEIWRSDGTPEGTFRLSDLFPGSPGSNPSEFTAAGDRIYFVASDGVNPRSLYYYVPQPATQEATRLANISTRLSVQTGINVPIAGFVVGGTVAKRIAIVGTGPSLSAHGIVNPLQNPVLTLVRQSDQAVIATNDDWQGTANAQQLQSAGLAPSDARESAILVDLPPGAYTAILQGVGGTTGVGVIGVYEVDRPGVPLVNISSRGQVLTGQDVMIGGFVLQGQNPQTVAIVATGPSLAGYGISNPLPNPVLTIVRASDQAVVASNDNWMDAANAPVLEGKGLAPKHPNEAALLVTLPPGAYTAIVSGAGGATGIAVVGVYRVN